MAIVLINCGSFNPITNLHLRMFELAKDYFREKTCHNVIAGIISPVNDLYPTSKKLVNSRHRVEMVKRSLLPLNGNQHWVGVDEWESNQNIWFRTLEVLRHHRKSFSSDISLKLLCGSDLFETFNVPNLWSDNDITEIVQNFGLVIIKRVGSDPLVTLNNSDKSSILLKHKANIHIIDEKIPNCISSTAIRDSIKNGESVRYLIPDPAIEYIMENNLYR